MLPLGGGLREGGGGGIGGTAGPLPRVDDLTGRPSADTLIQSFGVWVRTQQQAAGPNFPRVARSITPGPVSTIYSKVAGWITPSSPQSIPSVV